MVSIEVVLSHLGAGAFGAVLLYLVQTLISHNLAKELQEKDRRCAAAKEFRNAINTARAQFNPSDSQWVLCNRTRDAIRNFLHNIELAGKEYAPYLSSRNKKYFSKQLDITLSYCKNSLPNALAEISKNGYADPAPSQKAKLEFLNHIEELLMFSKET